MISYVIMIVIVMLTRFIIMSLNLIGMIDLNLIVMVFIFLIFISHLINIHSYLNILLFLYMVNEQVYQIIIHIMYH